MSVKKIFITLITVVACVMVGAFVLNVLMPNAITTGTNAVEDQLYKATGIKMDFNGDANQGGNNYTDGNTVYGGKQSATGNEANTGANGGNVKGFKK